MTPEERRLMRPPSITAIELMNNSYALDEWKEDPKTYCMVHCRVFNDFDEYMEEVVCEVMKLNNHKKIYI